MATSVPGGRPAAAAPALLATVVFVAVLAGCGSDDSPSQSEEAAVAGELPVGAEELVGRYAHYDEVAYEDDQMKTIIVSTGFADLEMRDGELWNVQRFCHADTISDTGSEIAISDAATSAIVPEDVAVEVTEESGSLRVVRPATPTGIGIDLEDPANDRLPTDPDDPRITDDDGDGNPGVTATVQVTEDFGGEIYLARREIFHYDVIQQSPDRLEGTITDSSEQLIVGASDDVFLSDAQWVQIDDPSRNPVIWERVDDDWDCERLAAERDALFPPNPETDW